MQQKQSFVHLHLSWVYRQRKITNAVMLTMTGVATLTAVVPLVWIIVYVLLKGIRFINLGFFLHLPQPMGVPGGGVLHAIEGSCLMVALSVLLSIPPALLASFYLTTYPKTILSTALRFGTDLLSGIPSIVVGLFGYAVIVAVQKHYSALAGGIVLAIIMLPVVLRSAEEMLKLVPRELREGSLALGAPEWKTSLAVVLPACAEGVVTGVMLAVARAAGETAPLIFTALGNDSYEIGRYIRQGIEHHQPVARIVGQILGQPTDALPLTLWKYAQQPYPERVEHAWAVALVLMLFVLVLNVVARLWLARRRNGRLNK